MKFNKLYHDTYCGSKEKESRKRRRRFVLCKKRFEEHRASCGRYDALFAFIRFLVLFSGRVAYYFAFDCDGTCDIMNAEFPKKKEHFLKEKNRLWRFLYGQSSDIW